MQRCRAHTHSRLQGAWPSILLLVQESWMNFPPIPMHKIVRKLMIGTTHNFKHTWGIESIAIREGTVPLYVPSKHLAFNTWDTSIFYENHSSFHEIPCKCNTCCSRVAKVGEWNLKYYSKLPQLRTFTTHNIHNSELRNVISKKFTCECFKSSLKWDKTLN